MKGQSLTPLVVATICLLIAAGCVAPPPPPTPTPVPPTATPVPPTPTPEPPTPVPPPATSVSALGPQHIEVAKAYFAAVKGHDIEAILALFADTFGHYVNNYMSVTTKDELRSWYEFGVGLGGTFEPGDCRIEDDTVICPAVYRDNCMDAGPVVYHLDMRFFFKESKIALLRAPLKSEEALAAIQVFGPLETWAAQNRAEEWGKLSLPWLSREEGEILTSICKAYIESQKAASATPTPAPPSDLLKLAQAYQDAFNRRDLDAALALFVDEGLSYLFSGATWRNKEAVREHLEEEAAADITYEYVDCAPWGQALRCTALVRGNCWRAACGLDVYHQEFTIMARGDKIQLMSHMFVTPISVEDNKACDTQYPKYAAWAEANRPEEWKKLSAPLLYDLKGRALGELSLQVCKAYLEATGK